VIGRHIGIWKTRRKEEAEEGHVTLESAVFALVGLILGFAFSGALTSFEAERRSIGQEANAISTAWERLDLLREQERRPLQALMLQYVDSRLEEFRLRGDSAAVKREFQRTIELQDQIWKEAVDGCRGSGLAQSFILLLPAINQAFEITYTRNRALQIHPPSIIPEMFAFLLLTCSLLAGYSMGTRKSRSWFHIGVFILSISITVFVITDLEFPYLGWFRVGAADYQGLFELREKFSRDFSTEATGRFQ
jgi:hypothetical protein